MLKSLVVVVVPTLIVLTGCVTQMKELNTKPAAPVTPMIDPGARKAALATLSDGDRREYCAGFTSYEAVLSRKATIGGRLRWQVSNAQKAANAIFHNVEAWYGGVQTAAETLRNTLEQGAKIGAFTELEPYLPKELAKYNYNSMNEPVFQVANFMPSLSHAYLILKEEYPEDTALIAAVKQWGDRLFEVTSNAGDDFIHRTNRLRKNGLSGGFCRRLSA